MTETRLDLRRLLISHALECTLSEPETDSAPTSRLHAQPGNVFARPHATLGLYYAPARWLWLDPSQALMDEAMRSGAYLIDVGNKWVTFQLAGVAASRVLNSGCNLEHSLKQRGCLRLPLFDCPVVLARCACEFYVCVEASYEFSWLSAVQTESARLSIDLHYI